MTLYEILDALLKQALLADKDFDNKEAIRLCLRIEPNLQMLDDVVFSSQFHLNFCKIYLNAGDINNAEHYISRFDFFFSGENLPVMIIDFRYYLMAKVLLLKGNFSICKNYIDQIINRVRIPEFRSKIYTIKGYIETEENTGYSSYHNMSLALAEAEKSGDKTVIAQCYLELGRALNKTYNALGISLLRQAERIAKEIRNNELFYTSIIQRANAYIFLGVKYNNEEFTEEAKRIINNINENNLKHDGLKELFWCVKGWILGDTDILVKALKLNKKAGAWGRVGQILLSLYHIHIEEGKKSEALRAARQGIDAAIKCGDLKLRLFFLERIKQLNNSLS